MSGAVLCLAGAGAAAGGGSGTPGAVLWSNIYAASGGSTNLETLSGITGSLSITATNSGGSTLYYTLNGVNKAYAGAFAWPNGQALGWYVIGPGSGTVAVSYSGTALASFTYTITNPKTGGTSP